MLLEILKLYHISREEKCLLHRIGHIDSPLVIEIPNRGVRREGGSVQGQEGVPSEDLGSAFNGHLRASAFASNLLLLAPGGLGP